MKKLMMFLLFSLFMISLTSAFEFDNYYTYDESTRTAEFKNGLTLGSTIAEIRLNTPLDMQVSPGYNYVFELEIWGDVDYSDFVRGIYVHDKKKGHSIVNRDIDLKFLNGYETRYRNITGCVSEVLSVNGTLECNKYGVISTQEYHVEVWDDLLPRSLKKNDNLIVRGYTNVQFDDKMEWYIDFFGTGKNTGYGTKGVKEWATWTSNLNVGLEHYYAMESNSNDSLGFLNGTNLNSPIFNSTFGKIASGVRYVNSSSQSSRFDNSFLPWGDNVMTINFWYQPNSITNSQYVLFGSQTTAAGTGGFYMAYGLDAAGELSMSKVGAASPITSPWTQDTDYHMLTAVLRSSGNGMELYLDGVSIVNGSDTSNLIQSNNPVDIGARMINPSDLFFNGNIDEFGIWNRSLNTSEINHLYNNGTGISFDLQANVSVSLNSPVNGAQVSLNVTFNSSYLSRISSNLTNSTLFIWDSDGNLFFTETNIINGTQDSTETLVTNLTEGIYEWNAEACLDNGGCNLSEFNNTFTWVPFDVNEVSFNENVFETSRQTFSINITTIASILSVDALLSYNGSDFTTTVACDGPTCIIETDIDIPLVNAQSENKSFFWKITVFDSTSSFSTNTSINQQNVTHIFLEFCNATFTVSTLNFTAFDEQNLSLVDPFTFEADFEFWLGTGNVKRTNNLSNLSASSIELCIQPGTEDYTIDAVIEYDEAVGSIYTTRNYYFQEDIINNVSQAIGLGLLKTSDSTSFILKVQDADILPLSNTLIFTQRFYPGLGEFRTVQVAKTDDNGKSVGFFEVETADYRFIIKRNGVTLLITPTGNRSQKVVGEETPFTLTFTVGEDEGASWEVFEPVDSLTSSLQYNVSSQIISFTYADTSEDFDLALLQVFRVNTSSNDILLCNLSQTQSSGIISCNMTGNLTGNYIAKGLIFRDDVRNLAAQIIFTIEDFTGVTGRLGLFLGWFVILIGAFAFKFNEIAGIIMLNVTMIFVNLIKLVNFSITMITAWIALSILILVVLER